MGMKKDRVSSKYCERLDLHTISTQPSYPERKRKNTEICIIIEHMSINSLNVTQQCWKPPVTFPMPTRTLYKLAEQPQPPGDQDWA